MNADPGDIRQRYLDIPDGLYDVLESSREKPITVTPNGDFVLYCAYCQRNLATNEMLRALFWHRTHHITVSPHCRGMVRIMRTEKGATS